MLSEAQAWQVLRQVPDPEIPVISVCELGIVREVRCSDDAVTVVLTPTYSGCPATEVISALIRTELIRAGAGRVQVETRLSPAWSTDWIAAEAREKLRGCGIVPPGPARSGDEARGQIRPVRFVPRTLECPRCGSRSTARLAEFGSTACKSLWRCEQCKEPFEYFKPL
jgi:ring-1,2-phenylacetyl-CoA epoxidase subunit PaaD